MVIAKWTCLQALLSRTRHPLESVMIGRNVSHYRILARLGGGGMGVVYRAEDTRLGREVALKFLPPDLTRDPEAKSRFVREARTASALDHPNICTIHEIDETSEGQMFLAMACYEGETLEQRIARGPLPLEEALDLGQQILQGLMQAHDRGIVHRDLKPANIFLTDDKRVKLLDFGLAKLLGETRMTRTGTTLGTVAYMSPEQARAEPVDHRTDLWSLGVVLFEMVAGRRPFNGDLAPVVLHSLLNDAPEPLTGLRTGVPLDLERLVDRCLEKDPEARYQTARDLVSDLRRVHEGMTTAARRPPTAGARRRRLGAWAWAAGIAAAAALALVVQNRLGGGSGADADARRSRLVVLPFENLGPVEDVYFAEGVTEEITARLASVGRLGVISRKSAQHYVDTDKTIPQIGEELGVDYVLEGTVRWNRVEGYRGRVVITPQLIRVSDDTHLWSEPYDRVITDIFAVQAEIAEAVVAHLGETILGHERDAVESRPTGDIQAYHAYLRGRYYAGLPHFSPDVVERAMACFEEAVALDPNFALAFAELSILHAKFYFYRYDLSPRRRALARQSIDSALALAPDSPPVRLALGSYYLFVERDGEKALAEFAIAAEKLPESAEVLEAKGEAFRTWGRWERALESYEQAAALSPMNVSPVVELALTTWWMRRYPEAVVIAERAIDMAPDQAWPHLTMAFIHYSWKGSLVEAEPSLRALPPDDPWTPWIRYWHEMLEGRYDEAVRLLEHVGDGWIRNKICARPVCLLAALAHELRGEERLAQAAYDSARVLLEREAGRCPEDPRYHGSLGIALAALGHADEALAEGRRAVDLLPISTDAVYGQSFLLDYAHILVHLGAHDEALETLDTLMSIPGWISAALLEADPRWRSLRDHPGYQRLIARHPLPGS